jgi:hypothetical protein
LVGKRDAELLGIPPVINAAPVVLSSDEMTVSPQGQAVLMGRRNTELLDIPPVINAALVVFSSDEMTVSPQGRAALVGRKDADPLGILKTSLRSFISPYLKLSDLHLSVQWNDIIAILEAASPLIDHPIMDLAAQIVQNG